MLAVLFLFFWKTGDSRPIFKISGISPHSKIMLMNRARSSSISLPAKMICSIVIPWKSADFPLFMDFIALVISSALTAVPFLTVYNRVRQRLFGFTSG